MRRSSRGKFRLLIPLFVLAVAALLAGAVYGLWNGILPEVLGVKAISYWQALGILVLAKILFSGFPGRGRGHFGPPGWVMRRRWESMTPEQREKIREAIVHRFGAWPPPWCDTQRSATSEKPGSPGHAGPSEATPSP